MELILVVVVALVVGFAVVAMAGSWSNRGATGDDEVDDRARGEGPTGTPYVTGSGPAGPGAEGMAVPEPGEISPGPVSGSEEDRSDRAD